MQRIDKLGVMSSRNLWFRVYGLGLRVKGLGFLGCRRVQGLRLRVQDIGNRVRV
jgi:hypothetical protein